MTIIVGADLDGTLCWNQEDVAQYRPFKKHMWYKKCQPTKYSNYPSLYSPSNNATNVDKVIYPRKLFKINQTKLFVINI